MARQERTARATRRAAATVEKIIDEGLVRCRGCGARGTAAKLKADGHGGGCKRPAQTPATASKPATATRTAPQPRTGGSVDPAAECRRLRDEQGMAWWLIGKTLGLPGAGNSAATGKAGAHQARRLYASTGKEVPRTRAPRGKAAEPKGHGQVGTKTERKIALTMGDQVIPEDLPDEDVVELLAGRRIEWAVNLADLSPGPDEWYNHEAAVHPTDVMVDEELSADGSRTLRFREFYGYEKDRNEEVRPIAGPTRTVRLRSIHTVGGRVS